MNKLFIDSVFQQIFHWLAIYKHWFENCYINEFINFSFLLPRDELVNVIFKKHCKGLKLVKIKMYPKKKVGT